VNRAAALAIVALLGVAAIWAVRPGGPGGGRPPSQPPSPAAALDSEGAALLVAGQAERAIPLFREAARLAPGDQVVREHLCRALTAWAERPETRGKEREDALVEALAARPGDARAIGDLALLLVNQRRFREAMIFASRLAEAAPADTAARAFREKVLDLARESEGMVFELGAGFTLVYSGGKRLDFEGELMALLQRERDELGVIIGVAPPRELTVLILTPDLGERGKSADPEVSGIYDGRIRLFLGEGKPDPAAFSATVRHELVHALLFQVDQGLPVWLHEGLAQKLGERITEEETARIRARVMQAMGSGWWVPPLRLGDSLVSLPPEERARAYAQSLLFVDFLQRRYGAGVVPRLLAALGARQGIDAAGREATGASPAEWERQFAREMGR